MKRVALVLPLVLVAACGGGSSSSSKSDYLAKAEALCKDANDKVKALTTPNDPASLQTYVEDALQIAETTTAKFTKLEPPADDKADLQVKVITPLEKQIAEGKVYLAQLKRAVAKKDSAELGRLFTNPPRQHEADLAWMKSYGFKECLDTAKTD